MPCLPGPRGCKALPGFAVVAAAVQSPAVLDAYVADGTTARVALLSSLPVVSPPSTKDPEVAVFVVAAAGQCKGPPLHSSLLGPDLCAQSCSSTQGCYAYTVQVNPPRSEFPHKCALWGRGVCPGVLVAEPQTIPELPCDAEKLILEGKDKQKGGENDGGKTISEKEGEDEEFEDDDEDGEDEDSEGLAADAAEEEQEKMKMSEQQHKTEQLAEPGHPKTSEIDSVRTYARVMFSRVGVGWACSSPDILSTEDTFLDCLLRCAKHEGCKSLTIHEQSDCKACILYSDTCDNAVSAIAPMMAQANHNRGTTDTVGGAAICNPGISTIFVKEALLGDGDGDFEDDNASKSSKDFNAPIEGSEYKVATPAPGEEPRGNGYFVKNTLFSSPHSDAPFGVPKWAGLGNAEQDRFHEGDFEKVEMKRSYGDEDVEKSKKHNEEEEVQKKEDDIPNEDDDMLSEEEEDEHQEMEDARDAEEADMETLGLN